MSIISDIPPDALAQAWEIIEKRRKQEKSEKLGREVGTWGGKRPGAFGLKREYNVTARLQLNPIQIKVLTEMGDGDISAGIEKLISEEM
jgi:hypothetical protein